MLFHGHTLLKASDVSKHIRSNGRQAEYIDRKGVHVVVGKYVGDSLGKDPTLAWTELNANNFDPKSGAGENGEAVVLLPSEELREVKQFCPIFSGPARILEYADQTESERKFSGTTKSQSPSKCTG